MAGTHRWKALRAWKAVALARYLWKGSSAPADKAELNHSRAAGATGSVSDQIRRLVRSQKSSAQVRVSVLVGSGRPSRAALMMVTASARDTNRGATRGRRCPRGYPAPTWKVLLQSVHERVRGRAGPETKVTAVRAVGARVAGFDGCS